MVNGFKTKLKFYNGRMFQDFKLKPGTYKRRMIHWFRENNFMYKEGGGQLTGSPWLTS
jgi:hypothetical protein